MTREEDPPPPWSCRLRSAQAAEREPRWHKGGPRIEARIQRVSVEPQWQKGRARGRAAAAVAPKVAARTSPDEAIAVFRGGVERPGSYIPPSRPRR